jgi:formylglycine-generating enzyme required for sulfatase activity
MTVTAYSDDTRTTPIGTAQVNGDSWLMALSASYINANVYLTLAVVDADDQTHTVTGESGVIPENGVRGIALAMTLYGITGYSDEQGNAVTANRAAAMAGETVTLTVTPASGYRLQAGTLKFNGTDITTITGNSATFTMPDVNVTIAAEFEAIPTYTTMVSVPGGTVETSHAWSSGENYPQPATVASFKIGAYAVTYDLWYEVYTWATDNARGESKYSFANSGATYSSGGLNYGAPTEATKYLPVVEVSWRDVVVWCNAYSEKEGKTAVYTYNGDVLRQSEGEEVGSGDGKAEQAIRNTLATG